MPYKTITEAQKSKQNLKLYSKKAKEAWLNAFNSAFKEYNDEGKAFAIAYAAANKIDGVKSIEQLRKGEMMDNKKLANELVKIAKEIVAGESEDKQNSGIKKQILDYIKKNEETLKKDKYAFSKLQIVGPDSKTNYMNVTIADLEAIAKVLK